MIDTNNFKGTIVFPKSNYHQLINLTYFTPFNNNQSEIWAQLDYLADIDFLSKFIFLKDIKEIFIELSSAAFSLLQKENLDRYINTNHVDNFNKSFNYKDNKEYIFDYSTNNLLVTPLLKPSTPNIYNNILLYNKDSKYKSFKVRELSTYVYKKVRVDSFLGGAMKDEYYKVINNPDLYYDVVFNI